MDRIQQAHRDLHLAVEDPTKSAHKLLRLNETVFVDTGINLDLAAGASQKPRLPKRSQILALIHTHVAQRTEGKAYPGERASPGQVDIPDSQRLDKETREMFESLIPRGKMGRPEEIAAGALFLASDESSYVNGWI